MQIAGTLVEIGRLEDESGADGFAIRRDDESIVTVKGLHMDEVRALAPHFLDAVGITVMSAGKASARDMAIAEAVRDACYVAVINSSAGLEGTVVRQIRLQALAAIIATIK